MRDVRQPRALATRERIVGAAARLFSVKGYHGTKLDEVLGAAGVTTGAFFHHFRGKEELGFAVLDRHMERRRRLLEQIERALPRSDAGGPLQPVFRRLDAIREMSRRREHRKGGCVIGNLSTALSDTHEAFRRRLAECFDEMARELQPHLDAAAEVHCPGRRPDTRALALYLVSVVEGSIMLARAHRDREMMGRHFQYVKEYLNRSFGAGGPSGPVSSGPLPPGGAGPAGRGDGDPRAPREHAGAASRPRAARRDDRGAEGDARGTA